MNRTRGFTLIELIIVVAVVAILLAIAVPAFNDQIRKSRRSDAFQALGDVQLRQEKWRSNNATYATLTNLGFGSETPTLPTGYYQLSIGLPAAVAGCVPATSNSYEITATAIGAQAADATCATIVLSNRCGVILKTSTPAGNTCWR